MMMDKRSVKYGVLMVKFIEKEQEKISIQYKLDKKLKDKDDAIN